MEALRTQLESLQWEVNRLYVENQELREADEQATRLVDLETELEQSKNEAAMLQETKRAPIHSISAYYQDGQRSGIRFNGEAGTA